MELFDEPLCEFQSGREALVKCDKYKIKIKDRPFLNQLIQKRSVLYFNSGMKNVKASTRCVEACCLDASGVGWYGSPCAAVFFLVYLLAVTAAQVAVFRRLGVRGYGLSRADLTRLGRDCFTVGCLVFAFGVLKIQDVIAVRFLALLSCSCLSRGDHTLPSFLCDSTNSLVGP